MIIKQNLTNKKAEICYLEILILILATFSFSYLIYSAINPVSAQTDIVQTCKEDKQGHFCQEYSKNEIQEKCSGEIFPGTREEFSECIEGCCFDSDEGICTPGSPKSECEGQGGVWKDNKKCNIPECELGCCTLGINSKFTTEQRCRKLSSSKNAPLNFKADIKTELGCILFTKGADEGACVFENNECEFTTMENCISITGNKNNFYKNYLCSHPELNTSCTRQNYTDCREGKWRVYWFDSCGNPENIYDTNRDRSWNSGEVLSLGESCGVDSENGNINSGTCGNCNYGLGSKCGLGNAEIGDYICKDLNCEVEINGEIVEKKNEESWCVYEGKIGNGKDVIGSRHIKHSCLDGEVILEPCADFRNEICVESINENEMSSASCRINRWRECAEINIEQDFERKKERCEENSDCMLKQVNIDDHFKFPVCTPKYPPGFDLKNNPRDAQMVCGQASQKCTVVYVKKLDGWDCEANCDCEEREFTEKMNEYCTSIGDCGAYVNVEGEITDDGYTVSRAPKLSQSDLIEFKENAEPHPNQEPAEPGEYEGGISQSINDEEYDPENEGASAGGSIAGGIIGGIGASSLSGVGNYLVETGIGTDLSTAIAEYSAPEVSETTSANAGKSGFWNSVGAGLGAAAGAHVAMKLMGGGIPADAALVANLVGSIGGAAAGMAGASTSIAAGTVTAGTAMASGSVVTATTATTLASGTATITTTAGTTTSIAAGGAIPAGSTVTMTSAGAVAGPTTATTGSAATAGTGALGTFAAAFIWAIIIAAIVIGIMKLFGIGDTKEKIVKFKCYPWQAPTGGDDCDKCNTNDKLDVPCSEYRCHSLGQTCEFINKGTGYELCMNNPPDDVSFPTLSHSQEISEGYNYIVEENGFRIKTNQGECIPEFTRVKIGVQTSSPAQCRISPEMKSYEDMEYFGGNNFYVKNHTMILNMPSPGAFQNQYNLTDEEIENLGEYRWYVKCKSVNGVINTVPYIIRTCVKPGPDLTAPYITRTIPRNNAYLGYNQTKQNLDIWVNEPSDCRYDTEKKDYKDMENNFTCHTNINDYGLYGWACNTELNVKNNSKFYIKCKDQPWLPEENDSRNARSKSRELEFKKSESKLIISDFIPAEDDEIYSGVEPLTLTVRLETSGGAENGKSKCYYNFGDGKIRFKDTFSNYHEQVFNSIIRGKYNLNFKCEDVAGNIAKNSTSFKIHIDDYGPRIIRIYNKGGLTIVTNEPAECRYGFSRFFSWENASIMSGDELEHTGEWSLDKYYIQCMDEYENKGNKMVIKPYNLI